jgi:ABC-2 type transport system ATP-binding protein
MHHGRLLLEGEPAALLADFPHEAYRIEGGDRDAVAAALAEDARVLAISPAGARVRVVLVHGTADSVSVLLGSVGSHLVPIAPDFEDLFLTRLREEAA